MSSMVDNMKFNVNDRVIVDGALGIVVDIVDDGKYRVLLKGQGLGLFNEEDLESEEDDTDQWHECSFCGDDFPESELRREKEMGWLCNQCWRELESREGELTPDDDYIEESKEPITEGKLLKYAKEFFKKLKNGEETKEDLTEGLKQDDLQYLVSPYVSVDEYTSKLSQDNITIALFCNEREVAKDLSDFIEKMYFLEIRDIEISDSLTEDNKYILFVEFERNQQFPKVLVDILDSVDFLIHKELKDWKFITLKMKNKLPVTIENLTKFVRLVPLEQQTRQEEIKKESVQYSKDNITRTYLDEGYVTEEEMNKCIESSDLLNESMSLDQEVLEYNFPTAEILTTEENAFIIQDGKIKKLGF